MFCPKCGQRQVAEDVRFCSGCGFSLNVVAEVLAGSGQLLHWRPPELPPPAQGLSPKQKGIRQGAMLMLSTLLIVPIVALLGVATLGLPGQLVALAAVICVFGGLLRILYALLFEESAPRLASPVSLAYVPPAAPPNYLGTPAQGAALPPHRSAPAPYYRPQRFNTGELVERPTSVTENTTRLLDKQPEEPPRK